jgi:hypothetical protein
MGGSSCRLTLPRKVRQLVRVPWAGKVRPVVDVHADPDRESAYRLRKVDVREAVTCKAPAEKNISIDRQTRAGNDCASDSPATAQL